jgi:hypothetical protein
LGLAIAKKATKVPYGLFIRQNFKSYAIFCPLFLCLFEKSRKHSNRSATLFDPWIRDSGWVKNQYPDPRALKKFLVKKILLSGSEIRNLFLTLGWKNSDPG